MILQFVCCMDVKIGEQVCIFVRSYSKAITSFTINDFIEMPNHVECILEYIFRIVIFLQKINC